MSPQAEHTGRIQCEDSMPVTITVSCNHSDAPYQFICTGTPLQQFAGSNNDLISVTSHGSINECRNIGLHPNCWHSLFNSRSSLKTGYNVFGNSSGPLS